MRNKTSPMPEQIVDQGGHQGDIGFFRVASAPETATKEIKDGNDIVLGYGEVTGHRHAIYPEDQMAVALMMDTSTEQRYLKVDQSAVLRHEEHAPAKFLKGTYEIIQQREYVYGEFSRAVLD